MGAMFNKEEGDKMEAAETIVGADVVVQGNLKSPSNILINGVVKGQVSTDTDANVGEGAKVEGSVSASNVTIAGEIQGNVNASESLQLETSGRILGDIQAPSLVIKQGATFNGKCEMSAEKAEESDEDDSEEEEIEEILETEEVDED